MNRKAQQQTQATGQHAHQGEFQQVSAGHGGLGHAQNAQHGAIIQMALGKAARGNRHRHRAQERGQQGHQIQKLLGAPERALHFRATAFERIQTHAAQVLALNGLFGPRGEAGHGRGFARHGQAVVQAAGGLHQTGGGDVVLVDHHPGRKAHEAGTPVGFDHDQTGHAKGRIAQPQRLAQRHIQGRQQSRIDPGRAAGRHLAGGHVGAAHGIGHTQLAAQGVAIIDRFERHQFGRTAKLIGCARHGRKTQLLADRQAQGLGFFDEGRRRGVVAAQHRITADQGCGVARQTALQTVGKKAHGTERGHGQGHRQNQQTQLARSRVAPQGAPTQAPKRHRDGAAHWVPKMRSPASPKPGTM